MSLKHAMSRVKDQSHPSSRAPPPGSTTSPPSADATPGEARRAEGRSLSAAATTDAVRASIESAPSFADDEDDDVDEDSPRNRGRQYDDRWKMPGHAESVLASFVERLEHRGHHGNGVDVGGAGESSAAAALAEARAARGVAIAVLGSSGGRPVSERATRVNTPGASTAPATPAGAGASVSKRRRSSGKNKQGSKIAGRNGAKVGGRSKEGEGESARRSSKGRVDVGSPKRTIERGGVGGAGSGANGTWSRIGSMAMQSIQRAAEAIAGIQKEPNEEDERRERRVEIERTREVASAFLTSSRKHTAGDQE